MSFGFYAVQSPSEVPAPRSFHRIKHSFAARFLSSDGSLRCEPIEIKSGFRIQVLTWLEGYVAGLHGEDDEDAKEFLTFIRNHEEGVIVWVGDWMDGPYGEQQEPQSEL